MAASAVQKPAGAEGLPDGTFIIADTQNCVLRQVVLDDQSFSVLLKRQGEKQNILRRLIRAEEVEEEERKQQQQQQQQQQQHQKLHRIVPWIRWSRLQMHAHRQWAGVPHGRKTAMLGDLFSSLLPLEKIAMGILGVCGSCAAIRCTARCLWETATRTIRGGIATETFYAQNYCTALEAKQSEPFDAQQDGETVSWYPALEAQRFSSGSISAFGRSAPWITDRSSKLAIHVLWASLAPAAHNARFRLHETAGRLQLAAEAKRKAMARTCVQVGGIQYKNAVLERTVKCKGCTPASLIFILQY